MNCAEMTEELGNTVKFGMTALDLNTIKGPAADMMREFDGVNATPTGPAPGLSRDFV